jgi:hypothetical protein
MLSFHAPPREIFLPPFENIPNTHLNRRYVSRMIFESVAHQVAAATA